jgi:hypothetical protein
MRTKRFASVPLALVALVLFLSVTYADETSSPKSDITVFVPGSGDVLLELYNDGGAHVVVLPQGHPYVDGLDEAVLEFLGMKTRADLVYDNNEVGFTRPLSVQDEEIEQDENDIMSSVFRSGSNTGWLNDARSYTYVQGTAFTGFWTVEWRSVSGNSSGSWHRSGTTATHIILHNQLCFNGVSLTITWPPSLTGSSNCGSYQSLPWFNRNHVSQAYNGASALSYIAMGSAVQSDSATVRFGNVDYRPASSVTLPR